MEAEQVAADEAQLAEEDSRLEALANELNVDRELRLKSALREAALMGVSVDSLNTLVFESGSRWNPLRDEPVWSSYETEWQLWA